MAAAADDVSAEAAAVGAAVESQMNRELNLKELQISNTAELYSIHS